MATERTIIESLLKLTQTGSVQKGLIQRDAKVTVPILEQALRKFLKSGLIQQKGSLVEASPNQRVNMAVQVIKLGADFERICMLLEWSEFESIAAQAFQANGFKVLSNFRFKQAGKRWEIDALCCKEPLIVCVDCKHWRHGWSRAATIKAVEAQVERTQAFFNASSSYYQKAKLSKWTSATLVPLILSLVPGPLKFHNNVPIVPILQLQDFISGLPLEVSSLTNFKKKLLRINENLTNYSK